MTSIRYLPARWVSQIFIRLAKALRDLTVCPATYRRSSYIPSFGFRPPFPAFSFPIPVLRFILSPPRLRVSIGLSSCCPPCEASRVPFAFRCLLSPASLPSLCCLSDPPLRQRTPPPARRSGRLSPAASVRGATSSARFLPAALPRPSPLAPPGLLWRIP